MIAGARRLHIYSSMHTQLDTTRIHIATSDRPMYTSEFGSIGVDIGLFDTTFLKFVEASVTDYENITHQSVSSMATYIVAITKITWNQEYWERCSAEDVNH